MSGSLLPLQYRFYSHQVYHRSFTLHKRRQSVTVAGEAAVRRARATPSGGVGAGLTAMHEVAPDNVSVLRRKNCTMLMCEDVRVSMYVGMVMRCPAGRET